MKRKVIPKRRAIPRKKSVTILDSLFQTTIDSSMDWIHVIDERKHIVFVNKAIVNMLQQSGFPTNPLGKPLLEALPYLSEEILGEYDEIFSTGKVFFAERAVEIGGRIIESEGFKWPVYDGRRVARIITIVRDVTRQKRERTELKESEERFKALSLAAQEGIAIFRKDSFLDCNERLAKILEAPDRWKIIGRSLPGMTLPKYNRILRKALSAKMDSQCEIPIVKTDKSVLWARISFQPSIFKGKKVKMAAIQDLTSEKNAEDALKKRADELTALSAKLQKVREDEKSRVSRQVHDELGQVLSVLKMSLSGLEDEFPMEKKRIKGLLKLSDLALQTARQIAQELRPSIVDDLGLISAIEWQLRNFKARAKIFYTFENSLDQFRFSPDAAIEIFRILQECLMNISRHSKASKVLVSLKKNSRSFIMSITDNGKGAGKIKIDSSKSIGIIGMRERARTLDGTFTIRGEPGKGTIVNLSVPLGRVRK